MNIGFSVAGLKEFEQSVGQFADETEVAVGRLVAKYLVKIDRSAKEALTGRYSYPQRVDTGRLRASIRWILEREAERVLGGTVYTDVDYAIYVHEGTGVHARGGDGRQTPWVYYDEGQQRYVLTSGMPANPFLEYAFNLHIQDFVRELRNL